MYEPMATKLSGRDGEAVGHDEGAWTLGARNRIGVSAVLWPAPRPTAHLSSSHLFVASVCCRHSNLSKR